MAVRIGDLDRRISIQANTPVQDETGEEIASWSEITDGAVWAKIEQGRGRQRFITDHELNTHAIVFKLRHRSDFDTEDRIVYNSENYDIEAIEEIGRSEGLFVGAVKAGA